MALADPKSTSMSDKNEEDDTDGLDQFEIDGNLCDNCRCLISTFFCGDDERYMMYWDFVRKYETSNRSVLWTFPEYQGGQYNSLHSSAVGGCQLCTLLCVTCASVYGTKPSNQQPFCIIALNNAYRDAKFYLCCRDLSAISDDDIRCLQYNVLGGATAFVFHRRNGDESNFQYFEKRRKDKRRRQPEWRSLHTAANIRRDSREAVSRALDWFKDCKENHSKCRRPPRSLPRRVLDLAQVVAESTVYLYESRGEESEYATLSYSWGKSLPLKTVKSNLNQHCKGMRLSELPQTLQDAVRISQSLGLRYIWIDALCIIQDDAADWATQAALMAEIYEGSSLCISASSSRDCDAGFLNLPNLLAKVGIYRCPSTSNEFGDIFIGWPTRYEDFMSKEFLNSRGWKFQERLVSVASLHYTNSGMFWECSSKVLSETGGGTTPYSPQAWKGAWAELRKSLDQMRLDESGVSAQLSPQFGGWLWHWKEFVTDYSQRDLTVKSDKLPAIAGIARYFAKTGSVTYQAGLWQEQFLSCLFWSRHRNADTLVLTNPYRAPSWSWASVDGLLHYAIFAVVRHIDPDLDLKINRYHVEEKLKGTFGEVLSGSFEASGLLQAVVVNRSLPAGSNDPHTATIIGGIQQGIPVQCVLDRPSEWPENHCSLLCLRLGVFENDRRASVAMLLLLPTGTNKNEFRRVGAGETMVWGNGDRHAIDHDIFLAGKRVDLTIV